jgi:hypothetical protein
VAARRKAKRRPRAAGAVRASKIENFSTLTT